MRVLGIVLVVGVCVVVSTASAQLRAEPKPKLYPNKHLSEVGETKANQDIAECTTSAAGYVHNSRQPGQGAKRMVGGAARGALLGTVGGAIGGNTGRGAGAGAVMGVTASALKGAKEKGANNPAFQQYANACLEDKGYKVLGWS